MGELGRPQDAKKLVTVENHSRRGVGRLYNRATMPRTVSSKAKSPLKRGASTALYQQIRKSILTDIWSGLYHSGDLLPSESDLSAHFGVNRLTVRQAVHALANQGFVRPLHGRGYQVTSTTLSADVLTSTSLSHYLQELGLESETSILSTELAVASSEVTDALGLRRGAKTVKITRHRLVLNAPIAVDEAFYDAANSRDSSRSTLPTDLCWKRCTACTTSASAESRPNYEPSSPTSGPNYWGSLRPTPCCWRGL